MQKTLEVEAWSLGHVGYGDGMGRRYRVRLQGGGFARWYLEKVLPALVKGLWLEIGSRFRVFSMRPSTACSSQVLCSLIDTAFALQCCCMFSEELIGSGIQV